MAINTLLLIGFLWAGWKSGRKKNGYLRPEISEIPGR
jgi:hypothetical protein